MSASTHDIATLLEFLDLVGREADFSSTWDTLVGFDIGLHGLAFTGSKVGVAVAQKRKVGEYGARVEWRGTKKEMDSRFGIVFPSGSILDIFVFGYIVGSDFDIVVVTVIALGGLIMG